MTNDEVRDELARLKGWCQKEYLGKWYNQNPSGIDATRYDHPFPPTLDGANAAVPEGWEWKRYTDTDDGEVWAAWKEGVWVDEVNVPDHGRGREMEDLYALAFACVRAGEKTNGKA